MINDGEMELLVTLIGQYIIDHADELIVTECTDMNGNEIYIRMIRKKVGADERTD